MVAEHPFCHWCGVEVVEVEAHTLPTKPPDNAATIDHVYSRLHPHRQAQRLGKWVLACWRCNQQRAIEEVKSLPIETLRARCGRTGQIGGYNERAEGRSSSD